MKRLLTPALLTLLFAAPQLAVAHCQVPCGIFADQRRFEELLEDTETIAKAITEIGALSGTHDATGHNQLARWVMTKEDHANNIQKIVGEYFLAQRIKSDSPRYVEQLKAAHGVIVAAMKTKQGADPATADALKKAINQLYKAYEGKDPVALTPGAAAKVLEASHSHAEHSHEAGHAHGDHDH